MTAQDHSLVRTLAAVGVVVLLERGGNDDNVDDGTDDDGSNDDGNDNKDSDS